MSCLTGAFEDLDKLIDNLKEFATDETREELSNDLAEEYTNFATSNFDKSQSPYGEAWEDLKWRVSANGARQKPLQNSSIMENAIHPSKINSQGFEVIVNHPGANVHQYGAIIRPVNAKCLVIPGITTYTQHEFKPKKSRKSVHYTTKDTGKSMFLMEVEIPARPYLPLNGVPDELEKRLHEATVNFIETFFEE